MPAKSDSSQLPKNWPSNVSYLTAPVYSKTLSSVHISSLRTRPKDAQNIPQTLPKDRVNGDLKPGTFILQYLGETHVSSAPSISTTSTANVDPHANSNYDLSLDRENGIGIDADKRGNEARFINDYRGIADKPNAEFKEVWDERGKERGMGVWVLKEGKSGKGKAIRKGDEILVSYGRGFWGARKEEEGGAENDN